MRIITKLLSVAFLVALLPGCSITHTYGPYMGKLVEKETGKPIEGAVVFMEFSTLTSNVGGHTTHYADALETLTDNDGGFLIPPYRINTARFMHVWDETPSVIIFKPGYGAFPRHRQAEISGSRDTVLPTGESVTIELPRLKTREERADNVIGLSPSSRVPNEKYKQLKKSKKIEFDRLDKGH